MNLPPEINYEIIRKQHPYYLVNGYCAVNKVTVQQCEDNKYDLLQQWVHPDLSLLELKKRYPGISLLEVVNLSLIYHPILETFEPDMLIPINDIPVDYKLILINAIKHRNIDVVRYILELVRNESEGNWSIFLNTEFDLLMESCFIYGYIEPLEVVWELFEGQLNEMYSHLVEDVEGFTPKATIDRYIHIIKVKLGLPFVKLSPDFYDMFINPGTFLWTPETFCEYIVIYSTLAGPYYFDKLIGKVEPEANYGDNRDDGNYMFLVASLVGKEKLTEIVNKYMKGVGEIKVYSEKYLESLYRGFDIPFLSKYTDYMSFGKLLFSPELAPQYITPNNVAGEVKANVAAYYLLSGLYDWYVSTMLKSPQHLQKGLYLASTDKFGSDLSFDIDGKQIESAGYPFDSKLE